MPAIVRPFETPEPPGMVEGCVSQHLPIVHRHAGIVDQRFQELWVQTSEEVPYPLCIPGSKVHHAAAAAHAWGWRSQGCILGYWHGLPQPDGFNSLQSNLAPHCAPVVWRSRML